MRRLSPPATKRSSILLSPREIVVAQCVSDGLGNAAIAERLSVSAKTVEKYVSSIFAKLKVRSRAQIAAVFVRGEMDGGTDVPGVTQRVRT